MLLLAWNVASGAAVEFQAGFATADITPPPGWRRAGGFSEFISRAGGDPLFAKAMVLSQGDITVALVGNDLCSVPRELTDRARKQASEQTGIPFSNIVITATHTHGGPEYYGPLRDFFHERARREHGGHDPHEPLDYHRRLVQRWTEVIVKAHAARKTAELSVVAPQQHALAFNRRFQMRDGSTGWNPGKLNTNIFRPLGSTDPDLPFVLVRDAASNKPLGSLTVFAMHTAIYGGAPFGACYPGHLQTHLRRRFDAPDFVSLFGEDCAGDVNHINVSSNDPQDGESLGIKSASPFRTTLVISLANDLDFYIPTRRAFAEGQYEPTACPLEPGCGERLVQAAVTLLNELAP